MPRLCSRRSPMRTVVCWTLWHRHTKPYTYLHANAYTHNQALFRRSLMRTVVCWTLWHKHTKPYTHLHANAQALFEAIPDENCGVLDIVA